MQKIIPLKKDNVTQIDRINGKLNRFTNYRGSGAKFTKLPRIHPIRKIETSYHVFNSKYKLKY